MTEATQFKIENIDEKVLKEIEKRKHCKNPFEDRFLNVTLSSFTLDDIPSLDDELVEIESSIMNASVNVSIRSELIKEMIKQTVKSVDHVIVSKKTSSNSTKADKQEEEENSTLNFEFIFNEERYKAFKENDEEKTEKFLTISSDIEHISSNQKLEELSVPQSFNNHNFYVLNLHQSEYFRTLHHSGNESMDHQVLSKIFQGFESVLEMEDDKVEELFALEGINIYEEIEIQHDDPMLVDNHIEPTLEENTMEVGGLDMIINEDNEEEQEQVEEEREREYEKKESVLLKDVKSKEKTELKYYRIIDMEKTIERKKSSKQSTLRTKQRVEDNLIEIKPRSDNIENGFFTKPNDCFNRALNDPEYTESLLFPQIDIFQLSNILSRSIEAEPTERAMYEIGGYNDCEYDGIDDYLFGNEISLLEDENNAELGGVDISSAIVEVTVPRTKTIIDNLIENVENKKVVPIVKISSIINDNLSKNQTTTLTEQYQSSHLGNQNVSKARFLMALLHSVHQTNIKGNAQITLSNVGQDNREVKIVTRNVPAKTQ